MEYLYEYGIFVAKAITIVAATLAITGGIVSMVFRQRKAGKAHLEVEHLNKRYDEMEKLLGSALASEVDLQVLAKADKKQAKSEAKAAKKSAKRATESAPGKRLFVLEFEGDIRASAVKAMREEITAVLTVATSDDEVLVCLESGGGLVYSYGLAASQLQRIRDAKIPLTIAVDKIAASGGYMMACVANKIIAAPFSLIGSIGVIAQIPNVHRLLKKHNVDFEQVTAGKYKRTLTVFGENTESGREKLREELEETHGAFKDFIQSLRPQLDVAEIATGETWLGTKALQVGLVDELKTSDDYLMGARNDAALIRVRYVEKKHVMGGLSRLMSAGLRQKDKLNQEQSQQYFL